MTKNKILDASIDLFSEYGYDGVSIRRIASEVGIRESSIYNHYPNKQSILKAILDYYVEEMVSDEIPIEEASLNLDIGFDYFYKAGCDAFLTKLNEDKMMKITRLFFIESYHNDEVKTFLKDAIIEAPIYGWMDLFNLMKEKNLIKRDCDVRQLSESFFYYGMFLLYNHFIINYPEDDEEFLKEFMEKTQNHARIIFDSVKVTENEPIIRLERQDDYTEVENMVRNSFWNIYRPGAFEHFIVHSLREDESFISNLAYVLESDNEIIGHINYSKGKIQYCDGIEDAVVLGPVAIDEDYQNQGLGTRLIEYTLKLAEDYGYVFVIGDENYYSRFGFESASKYNIYLDGTDLNDENPFFMIKIFDEDAISNELGIFHNPDVFNVDEKDVEEFDRQFEFKEKLVLEGKLGV